MINRTSSSSSNRRNGRAQRTMLAFAVALGLIFLVMAPSRALADGVFKPIEATITVTETVETKALGTKAPKGWTEMAGAPQTAIGVDKKGNPIVTVSVDIKVVVNESWYDKKAPELTIDEGSCKGTKLKLTKEFILAHEMEHVKQIRTTLDAQFNGTPEQPGGAKVGGKFSFDGKNIKYAGALGATDKTIKQQTQNIVDGLMKADQEEYKNKAEGNTKGFGPLEHGAREASCKEFMDRIGDDLNRRLNDATALKDQAAKDFKDARNAIDDAVKHARDAKNAAKRALEAAEKCDKAAYDKAVAQYNEAAKKAADDQAKAQASMASAKQGIANLDQALKDYEKAKQAAGVSVFTTNGSGGKDASAKLVDALKDLRQKEKDTAAHVAKQNKGAQDDLDAAKKKMDEAAEAFKKCVEKKKEPVADPKLEPETPGNTQPEGLKDGWGEPKNDKKVELPEPQYEETTHQPVQPADGQQTQPESVSQPQTPVVPVTPVLPVVETPVVREVVQQPVVTRVIVVPSVPAVSHMPQQSAVQQPVAAMPSMQPVPMTQPAPVMQPVPQTQTVVTPPVVVKTSPVPAVAPQTVVQTKEPAVKTPQVQVTQPSVVNTLPTTKTEPKVAATPVTKAPVVAPTVVVSKNVPVVQPTVTTQITTKIGAPVIK